MQSTRQRNIRHWLVLIFRILTITALSLAFAQPAITPGHAITGAGETLVAIHIDNSLSMEARSAEGELLTVAQQKAIDLVDSRSPSDRFLIFTNNPQQPTVHPVAAPEAKEMLKDIGFFPAHTLLNQIMPRVYDDMNRHAAANRLMFVFSDFQETSSKFEGIIPDSLIRHVFIPLKPLETPNISIDTGWFENPAVQVGQSAALNVVLRNHGTENAERITVSLVLLGSQRSLAVVDIPAGDTAVAELGFMITEPADYYGWVEISDFPVTFDDKLYLSFRVVHSIPVLHVYNQSPGLYIPTLFGEDALFLYSEVDWRRINFADLPRQHLLIFNGLPNFSSGLISEAVRYVTNGGSLLVIPPDKMTDESYTDLLESLNVGVLGPADTTNTRADRIQHLNPLWQGVFTEEITEKFNERHEWDLPAVEFHYPIRIPMRSATESLITLRNGRPFLTATPVGSGTVFLLASPLDVSAGNFPVHPIFVPAMYRMAILAAGRHQLYYSVGFNGLIMSYLPADMIDQSIRMTDRNGTLAFVPGLQTIHHRIWLHTLNLIPEAGNYFLENSEERLQSFSFNYDRRESEQNYLTTSDIKLRAQEAGIKNLSFVADDGHPIGHAVATLEQGTLLWKYFIFAALLFLLAEALVLRFLP